jgi:hypothetical protein
MNFVIKWDSFVHGLPTTRYWCGTEWSSFSNRAVKFDSAEDAYRVALSLKVDWVIDVLEDGQ